jgi:hypothetical protein
MVSYSYSTVTDAEHRNRDTTSCGHVVDWNTLW